MIPPAVLGPFALSAATLDRLAHRRSDDGWLTDIRQDPATRYIEVAPGSVRTAQQQVRWSPTAGVVLGDTQAWVLLGRGDDGVVRFALLNPPDAAQGPEWLGLREMAADLSEGDASAVAPAVALANWHHTHPRCPRCGGATELQQAGWARRCPADASEHHPRTDPAVIMAVTDDADRILLGRGASWPQNRYSTLAGFVEPGETLETAVRREVAEEAGVTVGEVTYLGSQPWPFPASVMIGCHATALDTTITVDPAEIADAQWFSRQELTAALADGTIGLPSAISISRRLIEHWYGEELPTE